MKVLIADDNPTTRMLLQASLKDWGYDVLLAQDGDEAWELLQQRNGPRVAILDWHMPERSGVSICRDLEDRDDIPFVYTIILTARKGQGDRYHALRNGAHTFLEKPIDFEALRCDLAIGKRLIDTHDALEAQNRRLRENEAKLAGVLQAIPDYVYILNRDNNVTWANDAATKSFDGNPLGQPCHAAICKAEEACADCCVRRSFADGQSHEAERITSTAEGDRVFWNSSSVVARDQTGRPAQVLEIARDITHLQQLRRDRTVYSHALQCLSTPVCISGLDGKIQHVNKAFAEMYGYAEEEVLGKTPAVLNPGRDVYIERGFSEKAYEDLFRGLWQAIGPKGPGMWRGEVINRCKNGSLRLVELFVDTVRDVDGKAIAHVGMPMDLTDRVEKEQGVRVQVYEALADLAEKRDNETGTHMKRIGDYAAVLTEAMGCRRQYSEQIRLFAPLHDIGKVGISDTILLAPRKLTDNEFETIKTHTVLGHEILRDRDTLEMAAEIALNHHERYDGTGYPAGLVGEDIPLAGRVVALVDVYDALRSERPYKEPWSHEKVVEYIQKERGRHFDPALVDAFHQVHRTIAEIFAASVGEEELHACANCG